MNYINWLAEIERDPVDAPLPTHSQDLDAVVSLAIERGMPVSVWLARALQFGTRHISDDVLQSYIRFVHHHYSDCKSSAHVKQILRLRGW